MHIEELFNSMNPVKIYHSEIMLEKHFDKTLFIITEELYPDNIRSYQVVMPKFVRDGIHLTNRCKTFEWFCLN